MKEVSLSERPADYSADNGKGAPTHVQLKSTKRWVKTPEGYHRRPEGWMSHIYYRCEDGFEWVETPSIDLLEEWQSDCMCETPTGEMVEPDHPRSWLFILGLI